MAKKKAQLPSAAAITAAVVDDIFERGAAKSPRTSSRSKPASKSPRHGAAGSVLTKEEAALSRQFHKNSTEHWSRLTREQQEAWDKFAEAHAPLTPDSGHWLFRSAQFERQAMGLVLTYEAPTLSPPAGPDYIELVASFDGDAASLYIAHSLRRSGGYKARISVAGGEVSSAGAPIFRPLAGPTPDSFIDLPRSGCAVKLFGEQLPLISRGLVRVQIVTVEGVVGGEVTAPFDLQACARVLAA